MVAAMAAKTVDAMVNVEPYNAIAEADGLANSISDFYDFDKLPVFMAATPEFVDKSPDTVVAYLKAWLEVAKDFKQAPKKVADTIYSFYTSKGYNMGDEQNGLSGAAVDVQQFALQRLASLGVERAKWLVHQQDLGIDGERAGDTDSLLHSTG